MSKKVIPFNRREKLSPSERLHKLNVIREQSVPQHLPKLYFIEGEDRFIVGRTDWPGDITIRIPRDQFDIFRRIYGRLNMPLLNKTHDTD